MVGNFIADSVRGKDIEKYSIHVRTGIEVHRFIDHFTDSHLLVLESRKLLYGSFGKYSQVVQDIFYDHFLASNWQHYHASTLPTFADKVYRTMERNADQMNDRASRTLHYMSLQNWLVSYASYEGIDRALKGMARRAQFPSNMDNAIPALETHRDALTAHFKEFMPELESAVDAKFAQAVRAITP